MIMPNRTALMTRIGYTLAACTEQREYKANQQANGSYAQCVAGPEEEPQGDLNQPG